MRHRRPRAIVCSLLLVLLLLPMTPAGAGGEAAWRFNRSLPHLFDLRDVLFDGRQFVAVGEFGVVYTSPDGQNWTLRETNTRLDLAAVAHGSGRLVAVGEGGLTLLSTDGVTWRRGGGLVDTVPTDIAFGNGAFVAVAAWGVYRSADGGESWLKVHDTEGLRALSFGAGQFVAVGRQGAALVSADGVTWAAAPSGATQDLTGVTYGGGQHLAVGSKGTVAVYREGSGWTATTGRTIRFAGWTFLGRLWTERTTTTLLPPRIDGVLKDFTQEAEFTGVGYLNDRFVAFDSHRILLSTSGQDWEVRYPDDDTPLRKGAAGAFGNGVAVVVGERGLIATASNQDPWKGVTLGPVVTVGAAVYGGGKYVAVGHQSGRYQGHGAALWSEDGRSWHIQSLPATRFLQTVAYGNGVFVAGGTDLLYSTDGKNWSVGWSGGDLLWFTTIIYGGGQFVAAGSRGIFTSSDGRSWSQRHPAPAPITGLAYGSGVYVAVGEKGTVLSSASGESWTPRDTGIKHNLSAVAFSRGRFVATLGSRFGRVTYGADGKELSSESIGPSAEEAPVVLVSEDGIAWRKSPTELWVNSVVAVDNGFVGSPGAAVFDGTLTTFAGSRMRSDDGLTWSRGDSPDLVHGKVLVPIPGGLLSLDDRANSLERLGPGASASWETVVALDRAELRADGVEAATVQVRLITGARGWGANVDVDLRPDREMPGLQVQPDRWNNGSWHVFRASSTTAGTVVLSPVDRATGAPVGPAVTLRFTYVCGRLYKDTGPGNPACRAVEALSEKGIVSGYADGTFRGQQPVTRAEVVKMLALALGRAPRPQEPVSYADTEGHWVVTQGYLQALSGLQIISGFPDGSFRPRDSVSRAQLMKMAAASLGLQPLPGKEPDEHWSDGWRRAALGARLVGAGAPAPVWQEPWVEPDRSATRGEAAMLLYNLRQVLNGAK